MAMHWKNPPKDKKQIRKREEKYGHIRHKKDFSAKNQYKNNFDKSYKKLFDVDSKYQKYATVKKYLKPQKIYKGITFLENNSYFNIDYIGKFKIIPSEEVEEELFRREMCAFKNLQCWKNDIKRRSIKRKKEKTMRFYLIINGKKECYGRFLESHAIQAKRVAELLINNSYIFDKTSPFYMSMPNIRKMVNRYLQTKKSLSSDLKALIIKIKHFC